MNKIIRSIYRDLLGMKARLVIVDNTKRLIYLSPNSYRIDPEDISFPEDQIYFKYGIFSENK